MAGVRRYLLIFTTVSVIILVLWHTTTVGPVSRSLGYLAEKTCDRTDHIDSPRRNDSSTNSGDIPHATKAHRIGIPVQTPADPVKIQFLWRTLQPIYENHLPVPDRMEHPNPDSMKDRPMKEILDGLVGLNTDQAMRTRGSHAEVVSQLPAYPTGLYQGKGIVMLAGGRYSEFAATSLNVLRQVGSTLPVELWVADESEEVDGWCDELVGDGIACRRLADYINLDRFKHPYQWKILTLVFSTFEEIVFLDADCLPLHKPDVLLDSDVYNKTGAIIWPDYWGVTQSSWTPLIIGTSSERAQVLPSGKSAESGQLVWNKRRHWKSLLLATYYNYHGPNFYYSLLNSGWAGWGDKDTFPTALRALNETFHFVPHDVGTAFLTETATGIAMIQADPRNDAFHRPFFLHANWIKWSARDMLCVNCKAIWPKHADLPAPFMSHLEDADSEAEHVRRLSAALRRGQRIIKAEGFQDQGMDPEAEIWTAMERTVCESRSLHDLHQCALAKAHIRVVFNDDIGEMSDAP